MVSGVLDKLPGIKADLVRGKPGSQSWGFSQLVVALREWTEIHPSEPSTQGHRQQKRFQAQGYSPAPMGVCIAVIQATSQWIALHC